MVSKLKYVIKFTDYGYKSLGKIASSDVKKVLKKIEVLESFSPETRNIKKMKSVVNSVYRLRIGDIRVLFEINKKIIWVLEVGYRGSIY